MMKPFVMAVIASVALMPTAATANRMGGGNPTYTIPSRPAPPPAPVAPARPQQPTYQPPAPQPQPQVNYGVFRAWGPLPEGRVNIQVDHTFEHGRVGNSEVYVQNNGPNMNDQMVIMGPAGKEDVWIDCHNNEEWKSYGPNTEDFIHSVVSYYCDWR